MKETELVRNRIIDLSRMSYERGIYTYSDFLTLAEQSDFDAVIKSGELYTHDYVISGGCEGAERVMVRFGSLEQLGYEEPWPIACIKIAPLQPKFAEKLEHRDVLGCLMNLGIERSLLGDIIADTSQECIFYIFSKEHIAETICQELVRIRHTSVVAEIVDAKELNVSLSLKDLNLQVKSERIDLVVSHTYNLSRSQAATLFSEKKIFINGRLMENESYILKNDDVVSVRGCGRFIYRGATGTTKKGNLIIGISKYC